MKIRLYDGIAIILSLSVFLLFTWYGMSQGGDTSYLVVTDKYGESIYPLDEDREFDVEGPIGVNHISIRNGEASFTHAPCDDQLCVQMGPVRQFGDWAACLPNEIFLYTEGPSDTSNNTNDPNKVEVDAGVY